ncbi:hypothetical protein [Treponema pedis]|uniref:hypothetical protein n=1 Tax=Treponema pedis TaxID=409322 RepID=UPI00040DBF71|nr:hypothetical protein [Treponema pedis]
MRRKIIENVKRVFEANAKLLHGTSIACKKIQSSYSTDVLNTSIAFEEIISILQNTFEYSKQTDIQTGIRMLFYGLSGRGKPNLPAT